MLGGGCERGSSMKSICVFSILLLSTLSGLAQAANRNAPASFSNIEEIRAWAEERRGFGAPEAVDFELGWIRLFVTYNSPFSGRSGVYSDAYYFNKAESKWLLIDSDFFEKEGVLSHVYVDANTAELVYVSFDGKVIKRFSLDEYKYK
jgi:hypothetical protein